MRLVNLTESILPKIGLNMTKTDQPYLFEHDRNMTMMNVNLLNSTENDWIWPKIENILNITTTMNINGWICLPGLARLGGTLLCKPLALGCYLDVVLSKWLPMFKSFKCVLSFMNGPWHKIFLTSVFNTLWTAL